MRNLTLPRASLPALLASVLAVGCGADLNQADAYNGVVVNDGTSLDAKFLPITSTSSSTLIAHCTTPPTVPGLPALKAAATPCYPAQVGFAKGKPFAFYNVLSGGTAVRTTPTGNAPPLFPMKAATFPAVYNFPGNCSKGKAFDARLDAYNRDIQYPIFSVLPLPTTAFGVNVLPIENLYSVSVTGNTCNDLKSSDSIVAGKFGAKPAAATGLQLWAVIDQNANLMALSPTAAAPVGTGWYDGLQLKYLDGGRIPVDSDGNVIAMDGVILNGSSFASAFDNQAVIVPAAPGDDAYSPVVRLNQFTLPSGSKLGDFVGVCAKGAATCPSNYVRIESTSPSFNTIFIVSTPQ